jgi:predicted transcriptional regulator
MTNSRQLGFGLDDEEPEPIIDDRLYLLLSLRPPYYYQMKARTKRYEYRRKFVPRPCTTFLYLGTTPRDPLSGTIPARVEFGQPIIDHPSKIGKLAESQKPGSSASILAYMAGLDRGYAIPITTIEDIERLEADELHQRFPSFRPPQSYLVLNNLPELLGFLLARSSRPTITRR